MALDFERNWKETSTTKYEEEMRTRPGASPPLVKLLAFLPSSRSREESQAAETVTGHVWPSLDPVRPFIFDSKANDVNARRAAKVAAERESLEEELNTVLGADDCIHGFVQSEFFTPGIENFLCPCGMLLGFDFLDMAESPSDVLAALVHLFPLLPMLVYFYTECQLAHNAMRRVPWLIGLSDAASSVDRVHNVGQQHNFSAIFDADSTPRAR